MSCLVLLSAWDIVIGGVEDLICYIILAIFLAMKKDILACQSDAQVLKMFSTVSRHVDLYSCTQNGISIREKMLI